MLDVHGHRRTERNIDMQTQFKPDVSMSYTQASERRFAPSFSLVMARAKDDIRIVSLLCRRRPENRIELAELEKDFEELIQQNADSESESESGSEG
jgi:hypothetical protein